MAISVVSTPAKEDFTGTATWSIDGPASIQERDLIIIGAATNAETATISSRPTGFTSLGGLIISSADNCLDVSYKVAGPAEAGPYVYTWNQVNSGLGFWVHIRGAHRTDPLDAAAITDSNVSGTAKSIGPITPEHINAMLVAIFSADPSAGLTTSAWTAGITATDLAHATSGLSTVHIGRKLQTSILAESIVTTFSASDGACELLFAVREEVAPTVGVVSPVNGATGVSITTTITAIFSVAMATATLVNANITVTPAAGSPIAQSIAIGAGDDDITITPSAALAYSTLYTVAIGTAVTDAEAIPLAAPASWTFTTEAAPAGGGGGTSQQVAVLRRRRR